MRLIAAFLLLASTCVNATIDAPGLSDRQYRFLTLSNSLRVILISDPTTDKAAASMDVYVGTNNDPTEFPGLAHFLEHMLFLGTDLYPEAGEYQQFISDQAGSHNAFTAPEHTNYFFSLNPKALEPALDRFSRFFVAPTLDPSYVDREVNAVHSEYQSKLRDAARLSFEATKQGLNPSHPFSQFGAGNLSTLKKPGLLEALKDFYENQYSANRMALAVLGEESLDTLEQMVVSRFEAIPDKNLASSVISDPLFDTERLPLVVQSKPATESRRLTLMFPIPKTDAFADKAPLRYIGHLLGHEGEGSLLSHLKQQGYANALSAGESLGMTESRSFAISVSLTPAGFENRDTIIAEIFKTIRLIETKGIASWRFEELKVVSDANFRFEEESDPQNIVTYLSEKLHSIPPRDLFTHGRLLRDFDRSLVNDMLSWLIPEQMLIRLTAPEIKPTETTTYYPTEINRFNLPIDRLKLFQKARVTSSEAVTLPEPNPFIQDPGDPIPATRKASIETQPRINYFSEGSIGYVLSENRYSQPKSDLYIRLRTPLASNSPEASIMSDILADAINEHFNSLSYSAALAGAGFSAQESQSGITLQFSGYHASLKTLVDQVLAQLPIPLIDESTWTRLRQLKSQSLARVQTARPSSRLFDEITAELMPLSYSQADLNEAFESIDRQTFHQYQKAFFSGLKSEMFLHGPISTSEGKALLADWSEQLPIDTTTPEVIITTNAWPGERTRAYDYDHPDQAAAVLYVDQKTDPRSRILNQLAGNIIEAPFYTRLRTEQQLGYITFATAFPLYNTPILTGAVQSPSASPDELAAAIQNEFESFARMVSEMPRDQFESQRSSLLDQVLNPPSTQGELSNAIWRAIGLRRPFSDRMEQAMVLQTLTREEFVTYLNQRLRDPIVLKAYRSNN